MTGSPFKTILLALLLAAAVAAILLRLLNGNSPPESKAVAAQNTEPRFQHHQTLLKLPALKNLETTNSEAADGGFVPAISREQAEAWLAKHKRNAMSLLAVFRALHDSNYLNEAAANFPNDPHVELAVLSKDEFPADRRKWLELLKNSAPSNSLANYLSAEDFLKNGKPDEAIQELLSASVKLQFNNFATENQLDAEALYSASDQTPLLKATYAMSDMAAENFPELSTFKSLARGIGDLEQQYLSAGNTDAAVNLAAMGMAFADQLQTGDSGKYFINQLVAIADESIMLSKLDQNNTYDFLNGQTPAQVLQELKDQKRASNQLHQQFMPIYQAMTPDEMVNYVQRARIYGEAAAETWVIQQYPPPNSQP